MIQTVQPATSLQGTLSLPADKSISHRLAMFAALHPGTSKISNFSKAADPHSTLTCLQQLGVSIDQDGDNVTIQGVGREGFLIPDRDLDCGNSGTTMRLLSGILAGAGIKARLVGDKSLMNRPMKRIIEPLKKMGAHIEARDDNFAPISIGRASKLKPLRFRLPIPSAQLKSCVLLAGLFGDTPTEVIETVPSRDHTERLLQLPISENNGQRIIKSSRETEIPEQSCRVPNDFSAAAFWLVAGAVHPKAEINLPKVGINPSRTGALKILTEMGASITINHANSAGREPIADLTVKSSNLKPIEITEEIVPNCIDELPVLAVAMLFADGASRISGAAELRYKETDRLSAMVELFERAGADFIEHTDGLTIYGSPDFQPRAAFFQSFHDHRIAMAAAILSLFANDSCQISGAGCTSISYPSFWSDINVLTN